MVANESGVVGRLRTRVRLLEGVLERLGKPILDDAAAEEAMRLAEWIQDRIAELNQRIDAEIGDTLVIDQGRLVRWSRAEADLGFFD